MGAAVCLQSMIVINCVTSISMNIEPLSISYCGDGDGGGEGPNMEIFLSNLPFPTKANPNGIRQYRVGRVI